MWRHVPYMFFSDPSVQYTRCQVSVLSLMSVITLAWLYVCFAAYNDNNDVLLSVSLVIVMLGIAVVSLCWTAEWEAVRLLLQATAPFLHLAAVVALTMISWLVFQRYHRGRCPCVLFMVFISPLFIYSPCISYMLPPKPALVAHRGAPMLAPENTMMSFRRSVACHVTAFETDVQLSKDMVPFLMHDSGKGFLHRTTNVDAVFPNRTYNSSSDITWEELQMLNAGDWFVKTDPFWSVSLLSEQEKTVARNQTVTSLSELLELSKERNISLIFDLNVTQFYNIDNGLIVCLCVLFWFFLQIWWLHEGHRECVKKYYPGFHQVYPDQKTLRNDNGSWLNMKYSTLSAEEISDLRSRNVKVNLWVVNEPWLFSLLWCSGVSSVTTNSCHILKDMSQPDWHLTPHVYKIIWITADLVSLLLMFIFFLLQR
uniref:Glycerophosphodiester phosphodiesterase domain containing 2 n=1 Tax=Electrophorus electricus TaxID=8005 RepID=A0A4W4G086_ELEEL